MLELLLTAADGGTAWRHQLAPGEARAGWECVGPLGLAKRLGRLLGIRAEPAPAPDRLAAWAERLDAHDDGKRSYSDSRKTDAFGVASQLLSLRDRLRAEGWRGGPLAGSARLADLAALEALAHPALPPGLPDVLATLAEELGRARGLRLTATVRLAAPRAAHGALVLRLLDALARAGATIVECPRDTPVAPATDLGLLQRALCDRTAPRPALAGDGSFLLVEADTPLEAGEACASLLRSTELSGATVVAAHEPLLLDAALARQGLPTLGLSSSSPLRPHLQFLPLRLALAFRPRNPFRASELLLLPGAPLPSRVRRALLAALEEMPGIGSPAWREAVDEAVAGEVARAGDTGAAGPAAAAAGKALARRIASWFGGEEFEPREGIPSAQAAALCEEVGAWAGARSGGSERDGELGDAALWTHAAAVARTLQRMLVARPPEERVPQLALAQLHALALADGAAISSFIGEAGRPAVCESPATALPGAATSVWFGFVEDAGAPPEPWTTVERGALEAAGLALAAPGEARAMEAHGWRRPLLVAAERAVLVRWRLSGTDPVPAHPLLDELRTLVAPGSIERCTVASERLLSGAAAPFPVAASSVARPPAVVPRAVWRVPATAVAPAGALSASQLESLLGCPFRWVLERLGALRPGRAAAIPDDDRLLGAFAHRLLQDMLSGEGKLDPATATEDDAAGWAHRSFDARVASEAAPLASAGREVERDLARTLVANAAASLVRHLRAGGWSAGTPELEVAGSFAARPVEGRVDLPLARGGRRALLDLKLSGAGYRRKELEAGRALQLALYSSMLRGGGEYPPAGYFILRDGQLLTTDAAAFPGATPVDGPGAHETLAEAEKAFRYWERVFAKGLLPITGEGMEWEAEVTAAAGAAPGDDSPGRREPGCVFCHFETVCRVGVGAEETS